MTSLPPGADLSKIPAALPPPGMVSNFVDPVSLANALMVVGILMLVLTILVVITRLFANYHATRGLGWDDGSCVASTAFFLLYVIATLGDRQKARHLYDIPLSWETPSYFKRIFVQTICVSPMIFFAKSSVFLLYYRLFKPKKIIRFAIIFGLSLSAMIYSSTLIVTGILCSPKVGQGWTVETMPKCNRIALAALIRGITNVALDIFLLVLPIPMVMSLQLSVKKKIGILAVFMVGSFALVASIIGMIYQVKLWQSTDSSWNGWITIICVLIETSLTLICGSTAALVHFWKHHISAFIAPLYSRSCSRSGKQATRFKVVSRPSSVNENILPQPDQTKSHRNWYSLDYVGSDRHQKSMGGSDDAIRTEIGGGTPRSDVETGVIHQFIKLEQSSS